jgi:quercetin dioxygenase-like cupin family protein
MTRMFCWTCLCLFVLPVAAEDKPVPPNALDPATLVTDSAQLPVDKSTWGSLQWLCNDKLSPGALQTVGLAVLLPGQRNPVHFHPNCEEVLYMLSGQGQHTLDGRVVELKAGMTIRIPAGVKHNLINTGKEPIRTVMAFSSGDRKTVFLDQPPTK